MDLTAATSFNIALAIGGGVVLVLGLTSGYVKNRLWVSEPIICLIVGVILGSSLLGTADFAPVPFSGDFVLKETARVTLALAVMGAALRLPSGYLWQNLKELAVVLGIGMTLMWGFSALMAWFILPFTVLQCILIGAILTPTDPVVAASVVTGATADENVPPRIRNSLTVESGSNDGIALLWVMLPILLMTRPASEGLVHWVTVILLWEVGVAAALGVVAGWAASKVLVWAKRQPYSEMRSTLTISIALTLTLLGALRLIQTDGFLGVFAAGLMLKRGLPEGEEQHEHVQGAISRFFDLPVFVLFGALLPLDRWRALGAAGLAFAIAVLLLRRLPAWLIIWRIVPSLKTRRETLFAGWFGPIGISSVYYGLLAKEQTSFELVWAAISLAAIISIVVQGVSATPFARRLASSEA